MKTKSTKTTKTATTTPAKAAPKTKTTVKAKVAPKKSPATTKKAAGTVVAPAKKAATSSSKKKLTRIVAHVDVGWGKMLYIRGEGAGLSWEQGIPMLCENDTEWHWVAETDETPISFKFLINDEMWALGENITINAGDVHISEPNF